MIRRRVVRGGRSEEGGHMIRGDWSCDHIGDWSHDQKEGGHMIRGG